MKSYQCLIGTNAVMWRDEVGNSGIINAGDPGWDTYLAFLAEGGVTAEAQGKSRWVLEDALAAINSEVVAATNVAKSMAPIHPAYAITEAQAWLLDNREQTPFVDELLMPWEDKAEFCTELVERASNYRSATGAIAYWQRIAEAAVEAYFGRGSRSSMTIRYPEVPSAS